MTADRPGAAAAAPGATECAPGTVVGNQAPRRDFDAFLGPSSLATTLALVFNPTQHIVRISEYVDLREEQVRRHTKFEVRTPHADFLFPIAFLPVGQLDDLIAIEDTDGVIPLVLGRAETITALRTMLRAQAAVIDLSGVRPELVDRVCELVPSESREVATAIASALRQALLTASPDQTLTRDQNDFLQSLFFLCGRRPLLVPCHTESEFTAVEVVRDVSRVELSGGGFGEHVRLLAGRLPQELRFNIDVALWAQSYHFRMHAPDLHYVSSVACSRRIAAGVAQQQRVRKFDVAPFGASSARARGMEPDSRGLAHLHLRRIGADRRARNGLLLELGVREQPMGQLGSAFARLLFALLAVVAVGSFGDKFVAFPGQNLASLVLALPGLLGASFFVAHQSKGVRGPLVARIGSGVAAAASITLSVLLAVWSTSAARARSGHLSEPPTDFPAPRGIEIALWIEGGLLLVLLVVVACLLVGNVIAFWKALAAFKRAPIV
ncbi:hypothetical protein [Nocardioides sp. MH1]|uniref:hypothetical protein n=1 Tax=Nocardioides sp. MH1 TaxID=3242490 RepID=UPI00351F8B31